MDEAEVPALPVDGATQRAVPGQTHVVCMKCGIFEDILLALKKAALPAVVVVPESSASAIAPLTKSAPKPKLVQKNRKRRKKRRSVWTVSGGLPDSSRRRH